MTTLIDFETDCEYRLGDDFAISEDDLYLRTTNDCLALLPKRIVNGMSADKKAAIKRGDLVPFTSKEIHGACVAVRDVGIACQMRWIKFLDYLGYKEKRLRVELDELTVGDWKEIVIFKNCVEQKAARLTVRGNKVSPKYRGFFYNPCFEQLEDQSYLVRNEAKNDCITRAMLELQVKFRVVYDGKMNVFVGATYIVPDDVDLSRLMRSVEGFGLCFRKHDGQWEFTVTEDKGKIVVEGDRKMRPVQYGRHKTKELNQYFETTCVCLRKVIVGFDSSKRIPINLQWLTTDLALRHCDESDDVRDDYFGTVRCKDLIKALKLYPNAHCISTMFYKLNIEYCSVRDLDRMEGSVLSLDGTSWKLRR